MSDQSVRQPDEGEMNPFFSSERAFDYWSEVHCLAAEQLDFAVSHYAALIVFTGAEGSGKSTVVRKLINETKAEQVIGVIPHHASLGETPRAAIFRALGGTPPRSEGDMDHELLATSARKAQAEHGMPILIVDDAHDLDRDTLQNLFDICGTETETPFIKLVLVGRTPFEDEIRTGWPELFSPFIELGLMSEEDTIGYVHHRCAVAGFRSLPFSERHLSELFQVTEGNPLKINLACMSALDSGEPSEQARGDAAPDDPVSEDPPAPVAEPTVPPPESPPESPHLPPQTSGESPAAAVQRDPHSGDATVAPADTAPEAGTAPEPAPSFTPDDGQGDAAENGPSESAAPVSTAPATSAPVAAAPATAAPATSAPVGPHSVTADGQGADEAPSASEVAALIRQKIAKHAEAQHEPEGSGETHSTAAVDPAPVQEDAREDTLYVPPQTPPQEPPQAPAQLHSDQPAAEDPKPVPQTESAPGASFAKALHSDPPAEPEAHRSVEPAKASDPPPDAKQDMRPRGEDAPEQKAPQPPEPRATFPLDEPRTRARRRGVSPVFLVAVIGVVVASGWVARDFFPGTLDADLLKSIRLSPESPEAASSPDADASSSIGEAGSGAVDPQSPDALRIAAIAQALGDVPDTPSDLFRLAIDISLDHPDAASVAYALAAHQGHARAAYYLGQIYETGEGLPVDHVLAAQWYGVAAETIVAAQSRLPLASDVAAAPDMRAPIILYAGLTAAGELTLVWTSAEGADPARYVVEFSDAAGLVTLTSAELMQNVLRTSPPEAATRWRVMASDTAGGAQIASGWVALPARPASVVATREPQD